MRCAKSHDFELFLKGYFMLGEQCLSGIIILSFKKIISKIKKQNYLNINY